MRYFFDIHLHGETELDESGQEFRSLQDAAITSWRAVAPVLPNAGRATAPSSASALSRSPITTASVTLLCLPTAVPRSAQPDTVFRLRWGARLP